MSDDNQWQQQQQKIARPNDLSLDGLAISVERDDDEQSIIDVFEFDDTSDDRWLCSLGNRSRRNSIEAAKFEDMNAWLHADDDDDDDLGESEASQSNNSSRRSIDTRTFTRIKRRSNKLNFDPVASSALPDASSYSLSNIWKNKSIPETNEQIINNNNNDKEKCIQSERRDSIPMMLRPKTNQVLSALLSESPSSISSQTSMEAFMNIASKEGNNFLLSDVSDPDVSSVLMNISQPSLLYSSIISDNNLYSSITLDSRRDENVQSVMLDNNLIDSQILTHSMMEASMFKEVQDTTTIAEFLKQNNDITVLEEKIFNKSFDFNDKTLTSDNIIDKTFVSVPDQEFKSCDATFVANEYNNSNDSFLSPSSSVTKTKCNSTKVFSLENNFLNTTHIIDNTPSTLNTTKIILSNNEVSEPFDNDVLSTINNENKTDLTFEIKSTSTPTEQFDATFKTSSDQQTQMNNSPGDCSIALDATFNKIPPLRAELLKEVQRSSGGKINATFTSISPSNVEIQLDVTYERPCSAEPLGKAQSLDATYVHVPSSHPQSEFQINKPCFDATYSSTNVDSNLHTATGNQPIDNKNSIKSQARMLDPNRFNTFRKDSKLCNQLSKMPQAQESNKKDDLFLASQPIHVANTKGSDNSYQQRYKTFSKKSSILKGSTFGTKSVANNQSNEKLTQPEFKPNQIPQPRKLSKLPQLFQKSNPNLGSNLRPPRGKLLMNTGPSNCKGSQPNIASNMQSLGRFKSERLLPTKSSNEFPPPEGTSRSMESIDSTTSAHSAPDLDDRHSVASDSSRTSYTIQPRNLEALRKQNSVDQKRKFNGSTPKIKTHQILENTWVQENNLPSPILKNGLIKNYPSSDSRSTSPSDSAEYTAKTSSPLTISPSNSDQTLNTIGNDDVGTEATKENIQTSNNIKPKQIKAPNSTTTNVTKMRRPSNWAGASNKLTNGAASGIPRPASRIPAPKFTRSNLK